MLYANYTSIKKLHKYKIIMSYTWNIAIRQLYFNEKKKKKEETWGWGQRREGTPCSKIVLKAT